MKQAQIVIEGNARQQDRVIHELQKLVSEANREPEVNVTMHTERVDTQSEEAKPGFDGGSHE
jgi:malonyl CoA-acyl carrier protein transacylase